MFSAKVICAIQVLFELSFGEMPNEGIKSSLLKERCTVASHLVTPVIRLLMKEGYIRRNNKGVFSVAVDLDTITLYSILSLLHSSMNIGDSGVQELKGAYKTIPLYKELVNVEDKLRKEVETELKSIRISDIVGV